MDVSEVQSESQDQEVFFFTVFWHQNLVTDLHGWAATRMTSTGISMQFPLDSLGDL